MILCCFHNNKQLLHEVKHKISHYLQQHCRLLLHPNKSHISTTKNGIAFLGQRVFPTHRLLKNQNVRRFRKRWRRKSKSYKEGELSLDKLEASLNSWKGHAGQADTFRLQRTIYGEIKAEGWNIFTTPKGGWCIL